MIKRIAFALIVINSLFFNVSFAQSSDTLTVVEYDTVVVVKDPVVVKRHVLSLGNRKPFTKELIIGLSVGINFFNSIYSTCKECREYNPYVDVVKNSQQASPGFNATFYAYRKIKKRFFYTAELRYSLYSERFSYDSITSLNKYNQLGAGLSLLYELSKSTKNRLFIGVGLNTHYLLSAEGKTVTIFKTETTANVNNFRVYNKLLGGVHIAMHWMKQLNERTYLLIHPELAFEITSFTSYNEYYLQNRFLYSLNFGVLRTF